MRPMWIAVWAVCVAACGGAGWPTRSYPAPHIAPLPTAAQMRVHFIDVAQGAATLLEFPCAAVLVDTGGELDSSYDSTAALTAYLDGFFVTRPDLHRTIATLFITHPHIDHDRGAAAVVARYHVQRVVTDGLETSSGGAEQAALHRWAGANRVPIERVLTETIPPSGLTDGTIDAVACSTIDPDIRVLWGGAPSVAFPNANNHSLVLRVGVGARSLLITGDLQEEGIALLLQKYAAHRELLDVDVYVAGHHGSHNGTTLGLTRAMTPEVSVFEMGPVAFREEFCAFEFGHPGCVTVDMLAAATTRTRPPIDVQCGLDHRVLTGRHLTQALYGTGWDGVVLATFRADGTIDVATAGRAAAPSSP